MSLTNPTHDTREIAVTVVVQARMGSTRLPGKVLMDLGGAPLLEFMLGRLSSLDALVAERLAARLHLVVATSDLPTDDPIVECASLLGVDVVRGSEADVLDRFRTAIELFPADHVVRLTADCPLIDPRIVAEMISDHVSSGADYTSNTLLRTFPDGLDAEVMKADVLRSACDESVDPIDREHVTPYVYRYSSRFILRAFRTPRRLGHLRWTVDTSEDLARLRRMVDDSTADDTSWISLLDRLPASERMTLVDGFEPANESDLDLIGAPVALDDASTHVLIFRNKGVRVGWVIVRVTDGRATTVGQIPETLWTSASGHYSSYLALTPLVTGGDLALPAHASTPDLPLAELPTSGALR